ncbi:MAG: hypothetical protein WC683_05040 [bacterium]
MPSPSPSSSSLTGRQPGAEAACALLSEPGTFTGHAHEAIIHLLDRYVNGKFYAKEPFQATVESWNTGEVPVIFAVEHPDFEAFNTDPETELARIATKTGKPARVVGTTANVRVEIAGHPKLIGDLLWEDADVDALHAQGKLSPSAGVWCPKDSQNRLYGEVTPHHVLIFEETPTSQPGDRGAVILSQKEPEAAMPDEKPNRLKKLIQDIKTVIAGAEDPPQGGTPVTAQAPPAESLEGRIEIVRKALGASLGLLWPDGTPRMPWTIITLPDAVIWEHPDSGKLFSTPYTLADNVATLGETAEVEQVYVEKKTSAAGLAPEALAALLKRKEHPMPEPPKTEPKPAAALTAQDQEIAELRAQNEQLKTERAAAEKAKKDQAWTALKTKEGGIPPGLIDTPEKEASLRQLAETDPLAFTAQLLDARKSGPSKKEGEPHQNQEAADALSISRELRQSTGRMR